MFKKFTSRIEYMITAGLTALLTVLMTALTIIVVITTRGLFIDNLGDDVVAISERASYNVIPDTYQSITSGVDLENYSILRSQLESIRDLSGAAYVYTVHKDGNGYSYGVDGNSPHAEDFSELNSPVETVDEGIEQAYESKKPVVNEITEDDYGQLLTAYYPVLDPRTDEVISVVGVDMEVTSDLASLNKITAVTVCGSLIIILLLTFGNYVIIHYVMIKVNSVTKNVKRMVEGNFELEPIKMVAKDQIANLDRMTRNLATELKKFVDTTNDTALILDEQREGLSGAIEQNMAENEESSAMTASTKDKARTQKDLVSNTRDLTQDIISNVSDNEMKLKELHKTVNLTVDNTNTWLNDMGKLSGTVQEVDTVIRESSERVQELASTLSEVYAIIEIIKEISSRTDILSLNAQIEAARAGEAGKGFAIVAQEVAKLSMETKSSVNKIGDVISKVSNSSASVSETMDSAVKKSQSNIEVIEEVSKAISGLRDSNAELEKEVIDMIESKKVILTKINESLNDIDNVDKLSDEIVQEMMDIYRISEEQIIKYEEILEIAKALESTKKGFDALTAKYKKELH